MRFLIPVAASAAILISIPAFGQALTEHGAALAGATIGSASGKAVSNGVTKIFGALDASTAKAAGDQGKSGVKPAPGVGSTPDASVAPATGVAASLSQTTRSRRGAHRTALSPSAVPTANVSAEPLPAPVKEPTLAEFNSIKPGASTDALVQTLGQPSSTITIPDSDHLIQVFRYRAQGQLLGVIHMDNGEVVNVEPVASSSDVARN